VFVYQGTPEQGPMFFESLYPDAIGIADPEGDLYDAFAIERGGWKEMFGLRPWISGVRAFLQGNFINRKIGDPWTLPSMIALRNNSIVWEFRGSHAGDHPDVSTIGAELEDLA
jgi:hypothetical protein